MPVVKRLIARLSACVLGLAVLGPAAASGAPVVPIDLSRPYRTNDYAFLDSAVGARPVVALGESIYVTREMPLVRQRMVRYLHEQKGFNALVLEGSLMDAWTAQEHVYSNASADPASATLYVREALFGLWQTGPREAVIAEALKPPSGHPPIYLTSFDIQPGMARAYGGSTAASLGAFLAAVNALDPSISKKQLQEWTERLSPSLECKSSQTDVQALTDLEHWIVGPAAVAASAHRSATHVAVLKLVPTMLHFRLQQCSDWLGANKSMKVYQQSRDAFNARLTLALLADLPKMILWAHHSHLNYNSQGESIPSMGQHLHAALGE
jgi:erythromycin esterase-like protein